MIAAKSQHVTADRNTVEVSDSSSTEPAQSLQSSMRLDPTLQVDHNVIASITRAIQQVSVLHATEIRQVMR